MKLPFRLPILALAILAILPTACIEESQNSGSTFARTSRTSAEETAPSQHDVPLRFLTAFIRLDRNMAMRYATPQAVSKLDWNMSHRGNIPYYDDKMLLQFNGGWARVYFQDMGGTFKIVDFEVHRR